MYRTIPFLSLLILLLLVAKEGNAQEAEVNNYLSIRYQQKQQEGPLRYMTFHNHNPQYTITSGYHQHLYYSPFEESTEQFRQIAVEGQYYLNTRTLLRIHIPYHQNIRIGVDSVTTAQGIGDIALLGSYQLYNSALFSVNDHVKQILFLGGGVQVPSGKFANFDELNELEPNFQPGRGNFSVLLEASWWLSFQKWHSQLKTAYNRHLANDYDYIFGPQWQVEWAGSWKGQWGKYFLIPSTVLAFQSMGQDMLEGAAIPEETARKTLWWSVGFALANDHWRLRGAYKWPLWEKMTGVQLENKAAFHLQLSYWFPTKKLVKQMIRPRMR